MWGFVLAIAGVVVMVPAIFAPAVAQTQQQIDWCNGKDNATADLRIGGCTALIQSGKYAEKDLAILFRIRGLAYVAKTNYDQAIADFDQSIRLNPQDSYAYKFRGGTYARKKNYDQAIADYDQSIRLNPQDSYAYKLRGESYAKKTTMSKQSQITINPFA